KVSPFEQILSDPPSSSTLRHHSEVGSSISSTQAFNCPTAITLRKFMYRKLHSEITSRILLRYSELKKQYCNLHSEMSRIILVVLTALKTALCSNELNFKNLII